MIKITDANKGPLITKTNFGSYDFCLNPYVGCQIGCTYCYVRFLVKDKEREWGDFVRLRKHIKDKLPDELIKIQGQRLVIGTMTDPYQPVEKDYKLTHNVLEIINASSNKPRKIGLFTRSPLVLQDIELLKKLDVGVHFTITPYVPDVLKRLEPIPIGTTARFKAVETLKLAGIKTFINISPVIPIWSEQLINTFVSEIAKIQPNGFTIDPMQAYGQSYDATEKACNDLPDWPVISEMLKDKTKYDVWKKANYNSWKEAWEPHKTLNIRPIFMDHQAKKRTDLRDGSDVPFKSPTY